MKMTDLFAKGYATKAKDDTASRFAQRCRRFIWDNRAAHIGKMIEIDSFGESKNLMGGQSLNCPIFKRFVGNEE